MVRRYEAAEPTKDLCVAFDRSDGGVRNILRKHGVKPSRSPRQKQLSLDQDREARELYEGGLNVRQVSESLGLSENGANRALKRTGAEMRPNIKRKLLSPEQGAQLAVDYKAGGTYESLTKKYGVSNTVIQRVLREHGIEPRIGWASYRTVSYLDRRGCSHIFKSSWELAYAEWLDSQEVDWQYEPVSFDLKVCRKYTPDFGIFVDGSISYFVEVKGWVTDAVEKRMIEFHRTYPMIRVVMMGAEELAKLGLVEFKYVNHPQAARVMRLREMMADA